jgi:hypothetical protein
VSSRARNFDARAGRALIFVVCLAGAAACEELESATRTAGRASSEPEVEQAKGEPSEQPVTVEEEREAGSSSESGEAGPATDSGEKVDSEQPEPEPELAAATTAAGPAYFVINSGGVAKLDGAGVTLIQAELERHVSRLFLGPEGGVYLLDARSLRKIEGEGIVEVERFSFDDVAPVDDLAFAPDGRMWLIGGKGVGTRVDGAWELTPLAELDSSFGAKLAISGSGRVWLVGSKAAYDREEASWVALDLSRLGAVPLLEWPMASPQGPVFATNGKQLIRLSKTQLELIPLGGDELVPYGAGLDIAADGQVGLATATCDLVRVDPGKQGSHDAPWRFAGEDYGCDTAEAIALDGRHRFWVASREGLSVVGADRELREYPAGSFVELAGRVSHMLVVGQGPELPPVPPVKTATLVGELRIGDEPGAKLAVELCPTVRVHEQGSPCAAAKVRLEVITDAAGRFRVEEAPIGDYSFAVEVAGKWRWSTPPSFAAKLRPGEEHELGTLNFPAL